MPYLSLSLTGRIEVLVSQHWVDGGVGELLPQQECHLLEVACGVVISQHVDRTAVSGNNPQI